MITLDDWKLLMIVNCGCQGYIIFVNNSRGDGFVRMTVVNKFGKVLQTREGRLKLVEYIVITNG